jgi:imidazolonepropionase
MCAALAVRDAGLTLEEAILGMTRFAAQAAGLGDAGSIAEGFRGDLAIFDHEDPRALAYAIGGVRAHQVIRGGTVVHGESSSSAPVW